jgi:hypothetical protein
MVASEEALQEWADEQVRILPAKSEFPAEWYLAACSLADLGIDPIQISTVVLHFGDKIGMVDLDDAVSIAASRGIAFFQSQHMKRVEHYYREGPYLAYPTFWPITNSAYISLERGDDGPTGRTSFLSCLFRRAKERGINLEWKLIPSVANTMLGPVHALIVTSRDPSPSIALSVKFV